MRISSSLLFFLRVSLSLSIVDLTLPSVGLSASSVARITPPSVSFLASSALSSTRSPSGLILPTSEPFILPMTSSSCFFFF